MSQSIVLLTLAVVLEQDTPEGRFITVNGELPANVETIFGVTSQAGKAGETVAVSTIGTAIVETFEAFPKGAALTSSTTGKAIAAVNGIGVVALAMEDSIGSGQFVEVMLK